MKVSVVYASQQFQSWVELDVEDDATIEQAIEQCGLLQKVPDIELSTLKVGVYGKITPLNNKLKEGDRVEIYRRITRVLDEDDDDEDDDD